MTDVHRFVLAPVLLLVGCASVGTEYRDRVVGTTSGPDTSQIQSSTVRVQVVRHATSDDPTLHVRAERHFVAPVGQFDVVERTTTRGAEREDPRFNAPLHVLNFVNPMAWIMYPALGVPLPHQYPRYQGNSQVTEFTRRFERPAAGVTAGEAQRFVAPDSRSVVIVRAPDLSIPFEIPFDTDELGEARIPVDLIERQCDAMGVPLSTTGGIRLLLFADGAGPEEARVVHVDSRRLTRTLER